MKINTYTHETMSIEQLLQIIQSKSFILEPIYQRGSVWSKEQSEQFLESLMIGYAPMPFIFNYVKDTIICIDGKQRLTALLKFVSNELVISYNGKQLYYRAKKNLLNEQDREEFNSKIVSIVKYDNLSYINQLDLFKRIQNGTTLTEGQLAVKMFTNAEVAEKFKKYCKTKAELLTNFMNISNQEHFLLLSNILYLVATDYLVDISKTNNVDFFDKLDIKLLDTSLKEISNVLDIMYGPQIFTNEHFTGNIDKKTQLVIAKFIVNEKNINYDKLVTAINSMDSNDGLKNMYDELVKQYEYTEEINDVSDDEIDTTTDNITQSTKKLVWNKTFGEHVKQAKCCCCKVTTIIKNKWCAARVICKANGGKALVHNLKPVCKSCKCSLKNKDMAVFIKEHKL